MHPRSEPAARFARLAVEHPRLRIRVRPWQDADAPALAQAADFADVARWLRDRFPHPYGIDDARFFLGQVVPASAGAIHAVEVEGEVAGGIGIEPGSDVYRIAGELGYWLTPPRWGQGIMQRVVRHYITAMAPVLGLRRVFARVYEGNRASMRVLEQCGFEREGVERRALIKHGQILDAHLYARCFDDPD